MRSSNIDRRPEVNPYTSSTPLVLLFKLAVVLQLQCQEINTSKGTLVTKMSVCSICLFGLYLISSFEAQLVKEQTVLI